MSRQVHTGSAVNVYGSWPSRLGWRLSTEWIVEALDRGDDAIIVNGEFRSLCLWNVKIGE